MHVSMKGNEQITKLLNDWYQAMLRQQNIQATNLKREIENKLSDIKEDENLLLYYSLLDFRYKVLTDGLNITKDSFNKINAFDIPADGFLSYYYHFFKAIHATLLANHNEAKEHYEKAENLLKFISNELEQAEFYYRIASFYNITFHSLMGIKYASKAEKIFSKHTGCEINVALCKNILGGACVQLQQFELAEEHFASAIDILQKQNEETLILRVRNNLGWLYASQNLSSLAIRHLSEVNQKIPNHFKAIFLEAREHFKLGQKEIADEFIKKGLDVCKNLNNVEYKHHFTILKGMNDNIPLEELETLIILGTAYFKKERLLGYIQEYEEILAVKFHEVLNLEKSAKYFYSAYKAKQKLSEKGALK
ncbi:Rap family tetratricopeptide repeat protein [Bacillus cereus group sp. BfR-BA-01380]|uniref:Rap family tetratricopeptide repeat protein n=1 Tax=Bacillus cereus group sp. BfR-BA-01380 TaxID=2920324 RepID=UPI001F597FD8|nr:Rap family tetratricopeptide repeat protein [Bacillus cereus group sp. BfR-BA-01380]